jgi:uncharacterized protein YijF (DUF1287 family)
MKKIIVLILLFNLIVQPFIAQSEFGKRLADSAFTLTKQKVKYVPTYFQIKYPNGDVPSDKGVCTDVIIRTYRKVGIDLQKEVHEDIKTNFDKYPKYWKLKKPDTNIDHRRVPNLMVFFAKFGKVKQLTLKSTDYLPGDIVCWNLGGAITHIGIVSNKKTPDGKRYHIIHNIGQGQVLEDCLFNYKIIGHYEYGK